MRTRISTARFFSLPSVFAAAKTMFGPPLTDHEDVSMRNEFGPRRLTIVYVRAEHVSRWEWTVIISQNRPPDASLP